MNDLVILTLGFTVRRSYKSVSAKNFSSAALEVLTQLKANNKLEIDLCVLLVHDELN